MLFHCKLLGQRGNVKVFFLLSSLFHVLFLLTAWFWEVGRPDISLQKRISLRIAKNYRATSFVGVPSGISERAEDIEKSNRDIPLPVASVVAGLEFEDIAPVRHISYLKSAEEETAIESGYVTPVDKVTLNSLVEPLDPLAGIDIPDKDNNLPEKDDLVFSEKGSTDTRGNILHLSWLSKKNRTIIFSPEIRLDDFVVDVKRLLDMVVRIQISPEGNVLDANLLPPGSGDIKLDRYIYSRTLEIVMEPVSSTDGIEEAELHLIFEGRHK